MGAFLGPKNVVVTGLNGKTPLQLEQKMKEEIFKPCNIKATFFYWRKIPGAIDLVRTKGVVDFCCMCSGYCGAKGLCRFEAEYGWNLENWCEHLYGWVRASLSDVVVSRYIYGASHHISKL